MYVCVYMCVYGREEFSGHLSGFKVFLPNVGDTKPVTRRIRPVP